MKLSKIKEFIYVILFIINIILAINLEHKISKLETEIICLKDKIK